MDQNTNQPAGTSPQPGAQEPPVQAPAPSTTATPETQAVQQPTPQEPQAPVPEIQAQQTPQPQTPATEPTTPPAASQTPPAGQPTQAKKGSPLPMILGAIVFVIILGVLGYVYMMSKQTALQKTPEPIHQAAVSEPTPTTAPTVTPAAMTPQEMKNMKNGDSMNNASDSSDMQKGADQP